MDVQENLPTMKADLFKLEQMLINLLDNAVKYTDRGEITVSVDVQDKRVRLRVTDTGIGIPKDDIPRIFERFYVVDKSRSRKYGGTGLGLSIVKHIVLLHHGTINIESGLGKGTTVTVTLPANPSASWPERAL
jgi:signal transduction histidine kinase